MTDKPKKVNKGTLMRKWLAVVEYKQNDETGVLERLTQLDLIMLAQIQKARKGDTNAFKAIMETAFPQVKEPDIVLSVNPAEMSEDQLELSIANLSAIQEKYNSEQHYTEFEDVSYAAEATETQTE